MITLYLVALKYLTASGSNPKASGTCGHTFGKYQTCFLAAENLNDFKSLMEKKTRKNCAFFFLACFSLVSQRNLHHFLSFIHQ